VLVRIRKQPFFADILPDARGEANLYHYVIQREGSNEILRWSQAKSEKAAIQVVKHELERLAREQQKAAS
jgi:hypothetical protein